jgi:hypothetical protein
MHQNYKLIGVEVHDQSLKAWMGVFLKNSIKIKIPKLWSGFKIQVHGETPPCNCTSCGQSSPSTG